LSGGVVFKEFRIQTAESLLSNPLFMKFVKKSDIPTINSYVSELALMNGYRHTWEDLEIKSSEATKGWLSNLKQTMTDHLNFIEHDIKAIK